MLHRRLMAHTCLSPRLQLSPPISQIKSLMLRDVTGLVERIVCVSLSALPLLWHCFFGIAVSDSPVQSINLMPQPSTQLPITGRAQPFLHGCDLPRTPGLTVSLEVPTSPTSSPCSLPCSVHITEKCSIRHKLWRSLSWSPPHLISHWVPFVWKMGSGAAIWAVSLIGRLGQTWCPGYHRRVDWSNSPF